MVTLGTLIEGNASHAEACDLCGQIHDSGGVELFTDEWSREIWLRAQAAWRDGKHPSAYRTITQTVDLGAAMIAEVMQQGCSALIVEDVYLPELKKYHGDRTIKSAFKTVVDGANPESAIEVFNNVKSANVKHKSKAELSNEAIEDWAEAFKHPGQISGITSGISALDALTWGWQRENLIIIGARPNQGKTAMLLGFARAAAVEKHIPTLFITLESSTKELIKRLACQIAEADQVRLRGGQASERDMCALTPAFSKINHAPLFFADCTGMPVNAIRTICRSFESSHGIKLVIVDYLQKVKPNEKHEKRTYEVAQASEGLKSIAKEMDLPVIAAAQLNREPDKQNGKGKGRAPIVSDLADSGQIERDADIIGLIHKQTSDDGNVRYSLLLAKVRDGPAGTVNMGFTPKYARFENLND